MWLVIVSTLLAQSPFAASAPWAYNAGPDKNGIIHPAQLGEYDITNVQINGQKIFSLKGMPLSNCEKVISEVIILNFLSQHDSRIFLN